MHSWNCSFADIKKMFDLSNLFFDWDKRFHIPMDYIHLSHNLIYGFDVLIDNISFLSVHETMVEVNLWTSLACWSFDSAATSAAYTARPVYVNGSEVSPSDAKLSSV